MNKKIIVVAIVATVASVGIASLLYFNNSAQEPETASEQTQGLDRVSGGNDPKLTARQQEQFIPSTSKEPSAIDKVAARSFAENILRLLQNHDYGKIYDLLTAEDKAAMTRTKYVKQSTEGLSVTITGWQIKEVLEEPDGASIQFVLDYDNPILGPGSETGIFTLARVGSEWFLSLGTFNIEKAVIKSVGDTVELTKVKYTVNNVEEKQVLTSRYGSPRQAKEDAKFVVIDMSIINITNGALNFPYSHEKVFMLVDGRDRQFNSYGDAIFAVDDYLEGRELAPGITERGVLVFEVPQNATSYGLITAKAGTNEVYRVILK